VGQGLKIVVPSANLQFSSAAPIVIESFVYTPAAAQLQLDSAAPTSQVLYNQITVAAGNLQISSSAPRVLRIEISTIGTGQDYSTVGGWESAEQSSGGDTTQIGDIVTVGSTTSDLLISGWTARVSGNYVHLRTSGDADPRGDMTITSTDAHIFDNSQVWVDGADLPFIVEGIVVDATSGGFSYAFIKGASTDELGVYKNCIAKTNGLAMYGFITASAAQGGVEWHNCVAAGEGNTTQGGFALGENTHASYAYNCMAHGYKWGFIGDSGDDCFIYNCIALGNSTADVMDLNVAYSMYNSTSGITDDGNNITGASITATDSPATATYYCANITAGSVDFAPLQFTTITNYQNAALRNGGDFSATHPELLTDISGDLRNINTFTNIGPYETCIRTFTLTDTGNGGDFTALSTWESSVLLSRSTEILSVQEAFIETSGVTFAGSSDKDVNRYREINVPVAYRHTGVRSTGFRVHANQPIAITGAGEEYTRITGVACKSTWQNVAGGGIYVGDLISDAENQDNIIIDSCLTYDCENSSINQATASTNGTQVIVRNHISLSDSKWASADPAIDIGTYSTATNCTVMNSADIGISRGLVTNCVVYGSTGADYSNTEAGSDYNISDDATAPGGNSLASRTFTVSLSPGAGNYVGMVNITASTEDCHLTEFDDLATSGGNDALAFCASGSAPTTTDALEDLRNTICNAGALETVIVTKTLTDTGGGGDFTALRYREINVPLAYRHSGVRNTGYRISATSAHAVLMTEAYNRITGVSLTVTSVSAHMAVRSQASNNIIDSCLATDTAASSFAVGFFSSPGSVVKNCVSYGGATIGTGNYSFFADGIGGGVFLNCTSLDAGHHGFVTGPATNCLASGSVGDDFNAYNSLSDYNISGDATAVNTNDLASRTFTASASPGAGDFVGMVNVTPGSEDCHLFDFDDIATSGGNDALAFGPITSDIPTIDAEGDARNLATATNAGAFETATVTKTLIGAGGGDYTTVAGWESSRQTSQANEVLSVQEAFEDARVDIAGATNRDVNRYREINVPVAYRHTGVRTTGYRVKGTTNAPAIQTTGENYVRLIGLAVTNTNTGSSARGLYLEDYALVDSCLIYDTYGQGILALLATPSTIQNTIAYDCGKNTGVVQSVSSGATTTLFNCTVMHSLGASSYCYQGGLATNCIGMGGVAGDFVSMESGSDYNISEDTSAPGANSIASNTFTASAAPGAGDHVGMTNITSGSQDCHLIGFDDYATNGDNLALAFGIVSTVTPTTDADDDLRNVNTFLNAGAYETCIVTKTLAVSGADYATADAWETDRVNSNATEELLVQEAFEDTTAVTFATVTNSDVNRRRMITVPVAYRHDGTRGTGYRIKVAGQAVTSEQNVFITITGVAAESTADKGFALNGTSDGSVLDSCLAYDCFIGFSSTEVAAVRNCIAYNSDESNFSTSLTNVVLFTNCTSLNPGSTYDGFYGGRAINCISAGAAGGGSDFNTMNSYSNYNISEDTTAPGANSLISRTFTTSLSPGAGNFVGMTNITASSEDCHLTEFDDLATSGGNDALVFGASGSAPTTTDAGGASRNAVPNAGAYEEVIVTKTLSDTGGGGDFTTAAAWESDRQSSNAIEECTVIEAFNDSGGLEIAGWVNREDYRETRFTVPLAYRHDGTRGTGYRMDGSKASKGMVHVSGGGTPVNNLVVTGVAAKNSNLTAGNGFEVDDFAGAGSKATFDSCLAYDCDTYGFKTAITGSYIVKNCISYGSFAHNFGGPNIPVSYTVWLNCTSMDAASWGFYNGCAINCLSSGSGTLDYNSIDASGSGGEFVSGYNISGDTSADDVGANNLISKTFTASATPGADAIGMVNVTSGAEDCHLRVFSDGSDNLAIGFAVTTSPLLDADGYTRDGSPDAGPYEYIVAPTTLQLVIDSTAPTVSAPTGDSHFRTCAAGQLTFSFDAPIVTEVVTIPLSAAQLQIDSVAPLSALAEVVIPTAAQLQIDSTAPTSVVEVIITPAAAQLQIDSVAPAVSESIVITPAAAQLVIDSVAPTANTSSGTDEEITPAAAQLQIDSSAPSLAEGILRTPAAAQLQIDSVAPSLAEGILRTPDAAQLQIDSSASGVVEAVFIPPAAAQLVIDSVAPVLVEVVFIAPAAAQLVIDSVAPVITTEGSITAAAAQLVIDSVAPGIIEAVFILPAAAQLQIDSAAPSLAEGILRTPAAAQLVIDSTALSLAEGILRTPAAAQLVIDSAAPSTVEVVFVAPAAAQLIIDSQAPGIAGSDDRSIAITAAQLVIDSQAPVLVENVFILPTAAQLVVDSTASAVSESIAITPAAAQLVIDSVAPVLVEAVFITPDAAQLVIDSTAPSVVGIGFITAAAAQLEISADAPTIVEEVFILPAAAQLQIDSSAPSLAEGILRTPAAAQLVIDSAAPAVGEDNGKVPAAAQLQIDSTALSLAEGTLRTPAAAQLVIDSVAPSTVEVVFITPAAAQLVIDSQAPGISGSDDKVISNIAAQLVIDYRLCCTRRYRSCLHHTRRCTVGDRFCCIRCC
jgi:hypothetical protein